jgi:hypothetical protein
MLTLTLAPEDRSRHPRRVLAQDQGRRQDQRPLPRHPRERRQRVRRFVQPRPALELHRRPGPGYQGLGPGSLGHVPGREA